MGSDCQKQYAGQKQTNKQTMTEVQHANNLTYIFFFFWATALKLLKLDLEKFFSSYLKKIKTFCLLKIIKPLWDN